MNAIVANQNYQEMSLEILSATNDGDYLTPGDLKLVEIAVNGRLSQQGRHAFQRLHNAVSYGAYLRHLGTQWLHNLQPMTCDGAGYIFYKGIHVEHYDNPFSDKMRKALIELRHRCEHLETIGVEVSSHTAIWAYDWFQPVDDPTQWPLLKIMAIVGGLFERNDGLALISVRKQTHRFVLIRGGRAKLLVELSDLCRELHVVDYTDDDSEYRVLSKMGFLRSPLDVDSTLGCCYAGGKSVHDWLSQFQSALLALPLSS